MGSTRLVFYSFSVVLVGGCSFQASCGGKKLDVDKGEKVIAAKLKEMSGMDATVTCPDNVKLGKDVVMECDVKLGELPGRAKVTQTDDQGNVNWILTDGYVFSAKMEEVLRVELGKQVGSEVVADCGERARLSEPGKTFLCKANAASGQTVDVEVTIKNKEGNVDFKLLEPPKEHANDPNAP